MQKLILLFLCMTFSFSTFAQDTKPSKSETVKYLKGKIKNIYREKYPNSTSDYFAQHPNFYLSNDEIITISYGVSNWKKFSFHNYWDRLGPYDGTTENTYAEKYVYKFHPMNIESISNNTSKSDYKIGYMKIYFKTGRTAMEEYEKRGYREKSSTFKNSPYGGDDWGTLKEYVSKESMIEIPYYKGSGSGNEFKRIKNALLRLKEICTNTKKDPFDY